MNGKKIKTNRCRCGMSSETEECPQCKSDRLDSEYAPENEPLQYEGELVWFSSLRLMNAWLDNTDDRKWQESM